MWGTASPRVHLLLRRQLPKAQTVGPGEDGVAVVGRDGHGVGYAYGVDQAVTFLALAQVPQTARAIDAGREGPVAVRGHGDRMDVPCVAGELSELLAGINAPQANG